MSEEAVQQAEDADDDDAAGDPPEAPEGDEGGKPMTFWEHLEELRRRLIWSVGAFFIGCALAWQVRERLLGILVEPFNKAWQMQHLPGAATLHFGAPGAAFVAYFKLSLIGGLTLTAPFIFYQLWAFIAPGLYSREKKYVIPFVVLSTALFCGGGYFGWRAAFPVSFNYLLSMSGNVGANGVSIKPTVMMGEYIEFVTQMLLGFGIVFEIPLVILFLAIAGIVNYKQLIKFARWFILGAFVLSAIITPPDVTSMMVMAFPMCALYVVSIGLAAIFGKRPPAEPKKSEA